MRHGIDSRKCTHQSRAQSLSTTLSTGRTEVRVSSAGVTEAVSQSDLDIGQGVGRIHGVGSCALDLGCGIGGGGGG